ncbi:MAG: phosphoesterase [Clostridiales bacterium]|nr:phosphoesterase [Clostridiales bacterium]
MKTNNFLEKVMSKVTVYLVVIAFLLILLIVLRPKLLVMCLAVFLFVVAYAFFGNLIRKNEIEEYIANLTFNIDAVTKDTLLNFQMPLVILEKSGDIVWSNSNFDILFQSIEGQEGLNNIIKEFKQVQDSKNEKRIYTQTTINERIYDVYANVLRVESKHGKEQDNVLMVYFLEKTDYVHLIDVYDKSKLCLGILAIDNYDELIQSVSEEKRSQINPIIGKLIRNWISRANGMVIEKDNNKYIIAFEKGYLKSFIDEKFSIIEDVKKIDFGVKMPATISGSIVVSDENINEKYNDVFSSLDVALGRGGDQIVLKKDNKFEFFGGNTVEVEKRTKVKTRVVAQALKEFMETSKNIIIMGHKQTDVDCIGAGLGLYRMAQTLGKEAYIVLDDKGDMLKNLLNKIENSKKYENVFVNKNEALSQITADTLLIVVDTHKQDYTECPELLNETDKVVVIDHHRRSTDNIKDPVLTYHEVYASSTCELVTEIIEYSDEKINLDVLEAESLYAGIMVDTKNFTLKSGVRTFEAAAYLRKQGVDVANVNQLFRTNFDKYVIIADIVKNMEVVNENIAISICPVEDNDTMLITAQAADELLCIENIQASFVLCKNQNQICISGRSLGSINVQVILEKLGGGGHINMAGAQLDDITIDEAKEKLKQVILGKEENA